MAQRYCIECRTTYLELSKVVQGVLASRRELVQYDQKKAELGSVPSSEPTTPAPFSTPLATPHPIDEVCTYIHIPTIIRDKLSVFLYPSLLRFLMLVLKRVNVLVASLQPLNTVSLS